MEKNAICHYFMFPTGDVNCGLILILPNVYHNTGVGSRLRKLYGNCPIKLHLPLG